MMTTVFVGVADNFKPKRRYKKMARTASNTFKRTVKYFDENFDLKEKTVEDKVPVAATYEEAVTFFGNDSAKILAALNQVIREEAIRTAMQNATGGLEERFISQFIKPLRSIPPFSEETDEKKQTSAILEKIKSEPFMLASLKAYCAAKSKDDDSDE